MGQERWGKIDLFLSHVSRIAGVVAARGVKPLVWDDELRKATPEQLNLWGLPDLVTPVVWKYTNDVAQYLPNEFWGRLSEAKLTPVYAASAFKVEYSIFFIFVGHISLVFTQSIEFETCLGCYWS